MTAFLPTAAVTPLETPHRRAWGEGQLQFENLSLLKVQQVEGREEEKKRVEISMDTTHPQPPGGTGAPQPHCRKLLLMEPSGRGWSSGPSTRLCFYKLPKCK